MSRSIDEVQKKCFKTYTELAFVGSSDNALRSYIIVEDSIFENELSSYSFRFVRFVSRRIWTWFVSPAFLVFSLVMYALASPKWFSEKITKGLMNNFNYLLKKFLDILGAIIGLILSLPCFMFVPILIKLDSEGPVFYSQLRVGKNRRQQNRRTLPADTLANRRLNDRRNNQNYGKPFMIYKFRTMREDAEKKCGPVWATEDDPRITSVGRILRYTHLDEIPQLFNILKGDMSFVGPRPERPYFVEKLAEQVPKYTDRLVVKPGLTGLAQLKSGYDYSIDTVKRKLKYDLHYCKNGNLYSYFKILFITLIKSITGKIAF